MWRIYAIADDAERSATIRIGTCDIPPGYWLERLQVRCAIEDVLIAAMRAVCIDVFVRRLNVDVCHRRLSKGTLQSQEPCPDSSRHIRHCHPRWGPSHVVHLSGGRTEFTLGSSGKCRRVGARRAGQGREAPKGSLDAPKPPGTIERRSDGTRCQRRRVRAAD